MKKAKRIAALIGAILLFCMYASTLFFAFSGSPNAANMLMASIACTIFIPVILYAMTLVYRVIGNDDLSRSPVNNDKDSLDADPKADSNTKTEYQKHES